MLSFQLDRAAPVGIERGVHHARATDELVQAESKEGAVIAACLLSALIFRNGCDQQQVAESATSAFLINASFRGEQLRRLRHGDGLGANPLVSLIARNAEPRFHPDRKWVVAKIGVADVRLDACVDRTSQLTGN